MTIHYVLQEGNFDNHAETYVAMVRPRSTADLEAVIERILIQGSTVGRADVLSVLEGYYTAIESLLLDGRNVTTPNANYRLSITGLFDTSTDRFDPNRHRIVPRVSAGPRLRRTIKRRARAVRKMAITPTPHPLEYTDLNSGAVNGLLTPGGLGRLLGYRLRFEAAEPAQGIVFLGPEGGETGVRVVATNTPRELVFLVPALAPGTYKLEVRAGFNDDEDVRCGALRPRLTVS